MSLWSFMVTFVHWLYFVLAQIASGSQFNECPGGGGGGGGPLKTIKSIARVFRTSARVTFFEVDQKPS